MDGCVLSGTLCQSLSTLRWMPATDLWACVTEVGWMRRWACICTGRGSGGRMDGKWRKNGTQVQSDGWVMGGDQVRDDGQVVVPWCVWVTLAPWVIWVS